MCKKNISSFRLKLGEIKSKLFSSTDDVNTKVTTHSSNLSIIKNINNLAE